MAEYALRSLRDLRLLRKTPLGLLIHTDEGRDARYSGDIIREASARAKRVLVLRPGNEANAVMTQRRGQRKYRFRVIGEPQRPGRATKSLEVLRWTWNRLEQFSDIGPRQKRLSVSATTITTEKLPMLLPHRVTVTVLVTYLDPRAADDAEKKMRAALGKRGPRWELELISDRPPMPERRGTLRLAKSLSELATELDIPIKNESSVWPSVAGLVPAKTACLCGVGPVARGLGTPQEAVRRISIIQRTLLLAKFLLTQCED